jgi:peptide subunit release factor 1 (eRF1)
VQSGGWSHRRFQQRAENQWDRNAREVAEHVRHLALRAGLDLVVLAGDVRARTDLRRELLAHGSLTVLETEAGGRAEGSSEQALDAAVDELVEEVRSGRLAALRERLGTTGTRPASARDGAAAVVEALRQGQVDVLVLAEGADLDREVWVGPDALQVALTRDELESMGVDGGSVERLDSALLRAAVASDAKVEVVPSGAAGLVDGVGALLRYVAAPEAAEPASA